MTLSVSGLFTALVLLLVIGILAWLAFYVLARFRPAEPLGRIFEVVIVVVVVLALIGVLFSLTGIWAPIRVAP